MIDNVLVDPATFTSMTYLSSAERKEYVEGQNIPHNEKQQQHTKDGLPVWSVQLAVTTWRGGPARMIKINIPAADAPAGRFSAGDQIRLDRIEFGVTPKREGNGYILWLRAGAIDSATSRKPAAVSSAA